jgi:3-phenylpropionate/trans-cinnamate dioxygenase ferredoxin reductase subunit
MADMEDSNSGGPCVIIGASLAGLRAAEGLRKGGYTGELIVYGAEPHLPYNRPPLSKAAMVGEDDLAPDFFRLPASLEAVEWRLGDAVGTVDLDTRSLTTESGSTQSWDGLVVASGLRPRRVDIPGPQAGRYALRTVDDAGRLRSELKPGRRAVIVGAGFIGCELAMTLIDIGLEVHLVDPMALPMSRAIGEAAASTIRDRLEVAGVHLHLNALPVACNGTAEVTAVVMAGGETIGADLMIEAIGSVTNTDFLDSNGLDLSDGLLCDSELRVEGRPDVLAAGDVARFPHVLGDGKARRIEHWTMAGDTGRRAGRNLALHLAGEPISSDFAPIPSFWSDLGPARLQSFGMPSAGMADVRILEGEPSGDVAFGYFRDGELIGVLLIGFAARYQHYRAAITATMRVLNQVSA